MISNYNTLKSDKTGDIYTTSFNIEDCSSALVNSFRRVCLSEIPVVGFDDTYHDSVDENHIKINKNISVLHNEFVSHRLSLIPVCMYKTGALKIVIKNDDGRLKYEFRDNELVPKFSLKIINTEETRKSLDSVNTDNTIDVTTKYFTSSIGSASDYLIPDYITGDYPLVHVIKPVSTTEEVQNPEELDIDMDLTIGIGKSNARYCPVGTISYEFIKDSIEKIDSVFEQYKESLQSQRAIDKLEPYNLDDIKQFKNSFMLTGADRVYKRDEYGEPTIKICVESIGHLTSDQIVYDAFSILELKTYNIMNLFKWVDDKYDYSELVSVKKNVKNGLIEIELLGENHTMGNLISYYLQTCFITNKLVGDYLSFASYRMPHPLEEKIVISVGLNKSKDIINLFSRFGFNSTVDDVDTAINFMFIAMSAYLFKLEALKEEWSGYTGIRDTSFEVDSVELRECKDFDRKTIFNKF
jgi:DNA-directed RNA polymerase subunit L/DNA-directed RNA polymerase alpha subunit